MGSIVSSNSACDVAVQDDGATANSRVGGWGFWLPLIIVWLSIWTVEHSTYFASTSFAEKGDGNEVVEATSGSSAPRQLSIVMLGALGAFLLVIPARTQAIPSFGMVGLILAACLLLLVSAAWADDKALSFKRAVQPVLLMVSTLGIAKHWQPQQLCRFAGIVTGAMLLVGVGAVLAYGTFWHSEAYRFGGTLHPNAQAVNCAVLCIASLALFHRRGGASDLRWVWLFAFVVGLIFLLLTRSRTTTAAFAAGLMTFYFVGASSARKMAIAAVPVVLAMLCGLLLVLPKSEGGGLLLDAVRMGRDTDDTASLTGRLPIWEAVLRDIGSRPLLGYGYGSFWTPQRVYEYSFIHRWQFNHAHSAYLETILNVGVVGLAMGLLTLVCVGISATRRYSQTHDVSYRFIAALIVISMVQGAVDSNFVAVGFAPLVIMTCVSMIALHAQPAKAPQPTAIDRPLPPVNFRTALYY